MPNKTGTLFINISIFVPKHICTLIAPQVKYLQQSVWQPSHTAIPLPTKYIHSEQLKKCRAISPAMRMEFEILCQLTEVYKYDWRRTYKARMATRQTICLKNKTATRQGSFQKIGRRRR